MRIFDLAALAASQGGEYLLGMKDLHSTSCYLIYGLLEAGESDRTVKPGAGFEEILCALDGPLTLHTEGGAITLEAGHAVHVPEFGNFSLSNATGSTVRYVIAGGPKVGG